MDDDIIDVNLQFNSFTDFYQRKDIIKKQYKKLSYKEKRIYKFYVYSTCFAKEDRKDIMWEFLNADDHVYMKIYEEYGKIKRRQ